ncbi:TPA: hypothetical protein ACKFM7_004507, partial [Burkholderia contaminans]
SVGGLRAATGATVSPIVAPSPKSGARHRRAAAFCLSGPSAGIKSFLYVCRRLPAGVFSACKRS